MASSNSWASNASQNTGNFISSRPTTRVHAPPGGHSSFSIGMSAPAAQQRAPVRRAAQPAPAQSQPSVSQPVYTPAGNPAKENSAPAHATQAAPKARAAPIGNGTSANAWASGANQNSGNFISDRPTSRVLSAPGGASSIVLG